MKKRKGLFLNTKNHHPWELQAGTLTNAYSCFITIKQVLSHCKLLYIFQSLANDEGWVETGFVKYFDSIVIKNTID